MPVSPTPALSNSQKLELRKADRGAVAAALQSAAFAPDGSWLPATNPYLVNAVEVLKADGGVPAAKRDSFALYLAASAFVHCGDGWSYFSRTLGALVNGDVHSAVHLCYYAELRAAMSLLSGEGIFVGNGRSYAITNSTAVTQVANSPTHRAAWQCLAAWLETERSTALLGEVVVSGAIPLSEWIDAMPAGGIQPVMSGLLTGLAFDLKVFADDRERRNAASYNPTRLVVEDLSVASGLSLIDQAWEALEPDRPAGFPHLDDQLLVEILKSRYLSTAPGPIQAAPWAAWLTSAVPAHVLGTSRFDELRNAPFLAPKVLLVESGLRDASGAPVDPLRLVQDMLGRALILLRMATGSYTQLIKDAALPLDAVEPWVSSLAVSRGIWEVGDEPANGIDLWLDVELARAALSPMVLSSGNFEALRVIAPESVTLTQSERVVAWSI